MKLFETLFKNQISIMPALKKILFYCLPLLLIGCEGNPASNKIFVLFYVIPFLALAFFIGSIIVSKFTGDKDLDGDTTTYIVVGSVVLLILFGLFKGCS